MSYGLTVEPQTSLFNCIYSHIGRWHYIQFVLLTISQLQSAFTSMSILLTGFQPPFRCRETGMLQNSSSDEFDSKCFVKDNSTNRTQECEFGFEFQGGNEVSFVAEWDLVCDKGYIAELTQTCYVLGMAVGATIVPHIADRLGRKPLLLVTSTLLGVSFAASSFVLSYNWYIFLKFAQGFFNLGMYDVKIVLIMEMFPARLRGLMIILDGLVWGVSITLLAALGYAFDGMNWRHIQMFLLPVFLVIVLCFLFVDESVRWLAANGEYTEARNILVKIAQRNGNKITKEIEAFDLAYASIKNSNNEEEVMIKADEAKTKHEAIEIVKYNVLDIMKHPKTRLILLGMCFVWFVNSLTYMGLFLMSSVMSGDRLLNVFLSAAVEIPAMGGVYLCIRWFGRRKGCIGLHAACAISLFLAVIFTMTTEGQTNAISTMVVCSVGKFAISASFNVIYFYTPELLPTNFRAAGLGISSGAARIGSIMAPFSTYLFRKAAWAPGTIFGVLSLLASVFIIYVPETGDKELPQRLEDIDEWDKDVRAPNTEDTDVPLTHVEGDKYTDYDTEKIMI